MKQKMKPQQAHIEFKHLWVLSGMLSLVYFMSFDNLQSHPLK